jgi:hypothetical protein
MRKLSATFGYAGAALTVAAAALVPFVLNGAFHKALLRLDLRVDEVYSGGPKVRTVPAAGYTIGIHRPVTPHMLQSEKPFVQLDWAPAAALPPRVSDTVDIDGDGTPDVAVRFDVPKDPKAPLHVDVDALDARYEPLHNAGKANYSALIVRVDDAVLVRVPVRR